MRNVLAGADAELAVEYGASAVIVSNHGGRQLDGEDTDSDMHSSTHPSVSFGIIFTYVLLCCCFGLRV